MLEMLYARAEHGAFPVRVVSGTYEILSLSERPLEERAVLGRYTTPQMLVAALTSSLRPTWSFDQYFRLQQDHPSSRLPAGGSALDVFAEPLYRPPAPTLLPKRTITAGLGINLERRGNEVRKLLFAGFGARIARSGYDAEEVLQEVYRGILARNYGKCPFDVTKSSFGHYVHMVCECILNNYHRREQRRRETEQVGMSAPASMKNDAGESGSVDAAAVAERTLASTGTGVGHDYEMERAIRRLESHMARKQAEGVPVDALTVEIATQLVAGKNRREIAESLRVSQTRVSSAIMALREHVTDF